MTLTRVAAADEQALFVGLGDGTEYVTALRADGREAVGFQSPEQGYRWTLEGGLQSLPCVIEDYGCEGVRPAGVSADGSIVIGTATINYGTHDGHAFGSLALRQVGSDQALLGFLDEIDTDNWSTAMSDDGTVVVGAAVDSFDYDQRSAFRWTEAGGMTAIPALGTGHDSVPTDVSADGSVIVGYSSACCLIGPEAFRWTAEDGTVGLDGLGTSAESQALGVSADGTVIVGVAESIATGRTAFRWTDAAGMELLIDPSGSVSWSEANAASADGSVIVGFAGKADFSRDALMWTRELGVRRLRGLLDHVPGLDLGGWKLSDAVDVSDDGRTIVGNGINPDGAKEAWLVFLPAPEPEALALGSAALGAALLLRMRAANASSRRGATQWGVSRHRPL